MRNIPLLSAPERLRVEGRRLCCLIISYIRKFLSTLVGYVVDAWARPEMGIAGRKMNRRLRLRL